MGSTGSRYREKQAFLDLMKTYGEPILNDKSSYSEKETAWDTICGRMKARGYRVDRKSLKKAWERQEISEKLRNRYNNSLSSTTTNNDFMRDFLYTEAACSIMSSILDENASNFGGFFWSDSCGGNTSEYGMGTGDSGTCIDSGTTYADSSTTDSTTDSGCGDSGGGSSTTD